MAEKWAGLGDLDRKVGEECGIVGIMHSGLGGNGQSVAEMALIALRNLQHRGTDAAGVAVRIEDRISSSGGLGLIDEALNIRNVRGFEGPVSLAHVRYGTSYLFDSHAPGLDEDKLKALKEKAIQPMTRKGNFSDFAIAWNGHVANANQMLEKLIEINPKVKSSEMVSDTSVIASLIAERIDCGQALPDALTEVCGEINGAFSVVVWGREDGEDKIWSLRDKHGTRPLSLGGFFGNNRMVASEPGAFDIVGAELDRSVNPGEMVVISQDSMESYNVWEPDERECVFENAYLGRPDGISKGHTHSMFRFETGRQLAKEHPADADIVIGVPESGWIAARGYARESGIPFEDPLIRNRHYPVRAFLGTSPEDRRLKARHKISSVIEEVVEGKRVVVVDDSLVRAETMPDIVEKLFRLGKAKEVHVRLAFPPITHPCFYGVDMPNYDQLAAANHTIEEIREIIGAHSLGYLSQEGLYVLYEKQDQRLRKLGGAAYGFCDACVSGNYPTDVSANLSSLRTS